MSATTPSDTTAKIGADCGSSPNSAPQLRQWTIRSQSPSSSIPSPTSRLPITHAFDAWSTTSTPIAIAANAIQRPIDGPRHVSASSSSRRRAGAAGPASSSTISTRRSGSSATRLAGGSGPRHRVSPVAGAPDRDPRLAGLEADRRDRHAVRRRVPAQLVGERLGGHGPEVRLDRRIDPVDPQHDPVVEVQLGLLAQVLDRALELAGVALGAEVGRQLGVEHDDEPVVVRDRGPRARRRLDLDLVRGERHAAQRHRAIGVELDRPLARGGHHGRDRGAQPLPDLRQQRLDPPLDERGAVLDHLDPLAR